MPNESEPNQFQKSTYLIALIIVGGIFMFLTSKFDWIPGYLAWPSLFVTVGIVAVLRARALRRKRLAEEMKTGRLIAPSEDESIADMSIARAAGTGLGAFVIAVVIIVVIAVVGFAIFWKVMDITH